MKKLIMVVALFVLPVSADAQSCIGYTGPGGVCYAGPGGSYADRGFVPVATQHCYGTRLDALIGSGLPIRVA
jgi:hypothetical protein